MISANNSKPKRLERQKHSDQAVYQTPYSSNNEDVLHKCGVSSIVATLMTFIAYALSRDGALVLLEPVLDDVIAGLIAFWFWFACLRYGLRYALASFRMEQWFLTISNDRIIWPKGEFQKTGNKVDLSQIKKIFYYKNGNPGFHYLKIYTGEGKYKIEAQYFHEGYNFDEMVKILDEKILYSSLESKMDNACPPHLGSEDYEPRSSKFKAPEWGWQFLIVFIFLKLLLISIFFYPSIISNTPPSVQYYLTFDRERKAACQAMIGVEQLQTKKRSDLAIASFKKAVHLDYDWKYLHMLGQSYFKAKQYETAADWLKESIKENEQYAESYYYLGHCYLNLENDSGAIDNFKMALVKKPNDREFTLCLAQTYSITKNFSDSIRIYIDYLRQKPDEKAFILNLFELSIITGKSFPDAIISKKNENDHDFVFKFKTLTTLFHIVQGNGKIAEIEKIEQETAVRKHLFDSWNFDLLDEFTLSKHFSQLDKMTKDQFTMLLNIIKDPDGATM